MPKRAAKSLTDRKVAQLQPPRRGHRDTPDGVVPGLVFRVSSSYRKRWFLWFRVNGRNTVRKLGDYPDMSLTDARTLAGAARESGNPLAFLGGPEDARTTVAELFGHYTEGRLRTIKSGAISERRLQRHVLPAWGERIAEDLTRKDMTILTDRLTKQNGPGECLATYQLVMAMLRWGVGKGHLERNPLEGYKPPHKVGRRDRILTDAEIASIWHTSFDAGPFGLLVRLLILTGLRRSEAAGIHDSMVSNDRIVIPADLMKSSEPHYVPLTSMLEQEIALVRGEGFLVSANVGRTPFKGFGKAKQLFDARLDIEPWTLHDIRRTVRSGLGALNINRDIAERCVAHKVGSQLDQIYDRHHYEPQMRQAMEKWAGHVRDLTTEPPANLVRLEG
jgi:integrase